MRKELKTILLYPKLTLFMVLYVLFSLYYLLYGTESLNNGSRQEIFRTVYMNPFNKQITRNFNESNKRTVSAWRQDNAENVNGIYQNTRKISSDWKLQSKCNMSRYLQVNKEKCLQITAETNNFNGENDLENYQYCDIKKVTGNCDTLRQSYLFGKEKVTKEEELFPIAFAMKIHTNPNQAHRLLRYLYQPQHIFCIHVDLKAPTDIFTSFKKIASCFDNIIVIEDRERVIYSSIKQVNAELKCMKAVMKANQDWKYYINLSGQEFILKSNLELVKILKVMNGSNDIETYPVPETDEHKIRRKAMLVRNGAIITGVKKKSFHNIKIHKGSAYGVFSREFVHYVLTDSFVKDFLGWLAEIYSPEEFVWATLESLPGTPGSRYRAFHEKDDTYFSRAVKWEMDPDEQCQGKYVHWICIYGVGDVPWLLDNRNLVANKFHDDFQPLAQDCVELAMYKRLLSGKVGPRFNEEEYKGLVKAKLLIKNN